MDSIEKMRFIPSGPTSRRHFEIGGAKNFLGVLVLIKKLEFLGRNWYLFSKSKNVGGAIAPPAPPPTRALMSFDKAECQ